MIITILTFFEKKFDLIIIAPHPTTIGNTAEEILYGIIEARKRKKKLLLLRPYQIPGLQLPLVNKSLFLIRSKDISKNNVLKVFGSFLITLYFGIFRLINKLKIKNIQFEEKYTQPKYGRDTLWNPNNYETFNKKNLKKLNWNETYKTNYQIELDLNLEKKNREILRKIGINDYNWFVCLHVRESGFWQDKGIEEYRNANIKNYIKAIQRIKDLGGITIRMGDQSMTKLPNIDGLIDYPFSSQKSNEMDIYLLKNCKLFIGMQSGILDVAILFSRPIIITNMISWLFPFPPKKGDLGILKHMYLKESGDKINLKNRMNLGWDANGHKINSEKYELVENTPDEILDIIEEHFNQKTGNGYEPLQNYYNNEREIKGLQIIEKEKSISTTEKYRLYSRLNSVNGALGHKYLEKNY